MSGVPGNIRPETLSDKMILNELDLVVLQADFGVAENGAVYCGTGEGSTGLKLLLGVVGIDEHFLGGILDQEEHNRNRDANNERHPGVHKQGRQGECCRTEHEVLDSGAEASLVIIRPCVHLHWSAAGKAHRLGRSHRSFTTAASAHHGLALVRPV